MKPIQVMILDDHLIVREGIQRLLKDSCDISISGSCGDASEAMAQILQHQPDVIIADQSMPGQSGIVFTSKVKQKFPEIKVLILSMFSTEDYVFSALQAGASGYLQKQDSTSSVLLEAIRKIYNGETYFSPSVAEVVVNSYASRARNASMDPLKNHQLTAREKDILRLYAQGRTNAEIAEELHISMNTVKTHKNNIMSKYGFKSTVEMIKYALRNKMIEW